MTTRDTAVPADTPRRVMHLLWDGGLGGVQRYVAKLITAPHWRNTTHAVTLFTEPGEVLNAETLPGIPVHALGLRGGRQLLKARHLRQLCDAEGVNVIHCQCDTPAFALQIRRFRDCRRIFTEHGDTLVRQQNVRMSRVMWRYSGSEWDLILANSAYNTQVFTDIYPYLAARVRTFPNPLLEIPTPRPEPDAPRGTVERPFRFVAVGRLVRLKGYDLLLAALAQLPADGPAWTLDLFGEGEERRALEAQVAQLGLGDRVVLHGFVSDPSARMAAADALVIPSRLETFGLVALEAQAVGLPVIGTAGTGVVEVVADGETGLIVPQESPKALAEALSTLLGDPDRAATMGRAGRERALSVFSLERHVAQLDAMYRGVDVLAR